MLFFHVFIFIFFIFFFFFKQKTAYEIRLSLVGSEMCIRDRSDRAASKRSQKELDAGKEKAEPYDISSLKIIISSGVIWSAEVKQGILGHHDVKLFDSMGSSEGGMASSVSSRKKSVKTAKFKINPDVIVLGDDGAIVEPGSGIRGLVGTSGMVPQGYYKDPVKSAQTFKEVHGNR